MADSTSLLSEGLVVADSYEIEHLLGRGGMGEVWLARHRRLAGKQVAVKVLRTGGQLGPEQLARFRREAEIAARLEHPNIVQVLDFNTLPTGEPFLVMELLKGEALASRLKQGPMAVEQARAVVRQVGSALQAAHHAGIIHRDLKPENIFLLPTALGDQVKVLDFGISKLVDSTSLQTTDSVLIGTPLYMSPEQATGHNRDVTAQSDLFSLGSICYEMLAGRAPFAADSIAKVVFRIAYEKHPLLAEAAPRLPASVIAAVEHALEKDRARRTPDIDTFVLEFTGQPMTSTASRDSVRGLYQPGMRVTDSMAGGNTVTPSLGQVDAKATPGASAQLGALPPTVKKVSRRALFAVLSGAFAAAAAALVVVVALPQGPESVPIHAMPGDFRPDETMIKRKKPDAAVAVVADAAVAPSVLAVADAGRAGAGVKKTVKAEPMTPDDTQSVLKMQALERAGKWDELYNSWNSRAAQLVTTTARRQGFQLLGLAACHRHDQAAVMGQARRLEGIGDGAAAAEVRRECKKVWAGFSE